MNRDRYRRSESETEESCVHTQRWRRRPHAESSERAQAIYVNDSSRGCRREARSLIFPAFCEHITWHSGDIFAQAASFARSHLLLSYQYLPVPFLSPDNDATSNPIRPVLMALLLLARSLSSLSLLDALRSRLHPSFCSADDREEKRGRVSRPSKATSLQ